MRKIIFGLIIFILSITSISFAAEKAGEKAALQSSPAKIVTAIDVQGNKSISTNTIVSKMKTHIGSPYQENVSSDDLKRLYLLGFFSDIKIDTQDYKDGVKVLVTVVERPIIEKITFSGMMRLTTKDEKLKEQLKSKETQYLDYPSLAEDIRILKKMYEKIGFSQVAIDYKVDVNKETNKAKVAFTVIEGKKVRIKDISVSGNKAFTSARILKLIKTKQAWFFNAGVLKEDVLKEDIERIKSFYRRQGFTDIAVEYAVNPDSAKQYLLHINIKIQEGKKYLVGTITIEGNKDIPEKEILSRLKDCTTGKVFSEEALKQDVSNIQSIYYDRGYISCSIQDVTSLNAASGRVDVTYSIAENQVSYVNKVKVRGNIKTKDIVIRREMRIHPGDRFDGDKLKRSKERLQNLGFFEEVNYDTEDAEAPDKKDLVVEVKESKTGSFSFGGGYSTVDQFVGFVEVEQKNFDWKNFPYFTGDGQDLRFRASFGSLENALDLSYTEPWLFDYPVSFGFDAYKHGHKRDTDVGYGYDEKVTGGDLRLGKELTEYLRGDLTYRLDQIDISNIVDSASNDLTQEYGKNIVSSLTPAFTFDTRDNVFDPKRGDFLTSSLEWAGLGGDKKFWKLYGQASHYFPMPRNSVIEIKGRVGLAEPYSGVERLPIYERFFAGGAYTLRGYDERKVGPIDKGSQEPLGGASMLIGNLEYTYPLFDFLKVAAFYDVGNVWDKLSDIASSKNFNDIPNSGGFKNDFGIGFRIKTPVGPISLDYGIPLNKEPGEDSRKSGRFNFSASKGF